MNPHFGMASNENEPFLNAFKKRGGGAVETEMSDFH